VDAHAGLLAQETKVVHEPFLVLAAADEGTDFGVEGLDADLIRGGAFVPLMGRELRPVGTLSLFWRNEAEPACLLPAPEWSAAERSPAKWTAAPGEPSWGLGA